MVFILSVSDFRQLSVCVIIFIFIGYFSAKRKRKCRTKKRIILPFDCWTEILQWLEKPEEIDRLSLLNPGFLPIFNQNLRIKYRKKKKISMDLRFYRQNGIAKLCKVQSGREVPIAEVSPPDYLAPPKNIIVK